MAPLAAAPRGNAARDARLLTGVTCLFLLGVPTVLYSNWDYIRFQLFATAPAVTFEAVGMIGIQLYSVWLPIACETLFYHLHPEEANSVRRQAGKSAQQRQQWRDCLRVVLRNQLVASALHITLLVSSKRPTTLIDAVGMRGLLRARAGCYAGPLARGRRATALGAAPRARCPPSAPAFGRRRPSSACSARGP
jgi:hypothetical protein